MVDVVGMMERQAQVEQREKDACEFLKTVTLAREFYNIRVMTPSGRFFQGKSEVARYFKEGADREICLLRNENQSLRKTSLEDSSGSIAVITKMLTEELIRIKEIYGTEAEYLRLEQQLKEDDRGKEWSLELKPLCVALINKADLRSRLWTSQALYGGVWGYAPSELFDLMDTSRIDNSRSRLMSNLFDVNDFGYLV